MRTTIAARFAARRYPAARRDPQSGRDLVRGGEPVGDLSIDTARRRVKDGLHSLPWEGLKLAHGEPAIPTMQIPA